MDHTQHDHSIKQEMNNKRNSDHGMMDLKTMKMESLDHHNMPMGMEGHDHHQMMIADFNPLIAGNEAIMVFRDSTT